MSILVYLPAKFTLTLMFILDVVDLEDQ